MNAIIPDPYRISRAQRVETTDYGSISTTRFVSGDVMIALRRGGLETTMHLTLAEAREVAAMLREVVA